MLGSSRGRLSEDQLASRPVDYLLLHLVSLDQANLLAAKNYTEFGRDVRGLAENLDTLAEVVGRAKASLHNQSQVPMHNAVVRWDESSLEQIIGDYKSTLRECHDLIRSNQRYYRTNVMRNIEWNVLIQPNADRLRQRILLHNSKIFHFLKPFEM